MPDVALVAVADTQPHAAAAAAQLYGTRPVTDFRELLNQVDAVTVAVPTTAHRSVASEFLGRGIPVMVEKPLAGSLADATALVELAERHNALLQVGHVERFNPATTTAWSEVGRPKYVRAERLSTYTFRSTDIGVVHDLMIHDLDLVLDLVKNPVVSVEAFGIGLMGTHEDCVQARLRFANGCLADLTASRVSAVARRTMQIWSDRGCATIDFSSREVTCYSPTPALRYGPRPAELAQRPGADLESLKRDVFGRFIHVQNPEVLPTDALSAELHSFVTAVRDRSAPLVDGRQALEALVVCERILESVAAHSWDASAAGPSPQFAPRLQQAG
jgi:predicted dehydrogenase